MVAPSITVSETTDRELIGRWLMRPSILRKLLGSNQDAEHVHREFDSLMNTDAVFFAVHVSGDEKGVIMFKRVAGGWEMHLCLATWFTHTRMAVAQAIEALDACVVFANYDPERRAVTRLLDDIGFSAGAIINGILSREYHLQPTA